MSSQNLEVCQFKFQQGGKKEVDFDARACLPTVSLEGSACAALSSRASVSHLWRCHQARQVSCPVWLLPLISSVSCALPSLTLMAHK